MQKLLDFLKKAIKETKTHAISAITVKSIVHEINLYLKEANKQTGVKKWQK
jgi:hypothetical protein